jgi:hypothetical protein
MSRVKWWLSCLGLGVFLFGLAYLWWPDTVSQIEPVGVEGGHDVMLSVDQRQYLWDIEHLAFVLEQKLFPLLNASLSESAGTAIRPWLEAGFSADVPGGAWREVYSNPTVNLRERDLNEESSQKVAADGFLQFWRELREKFSQANDSCTARIGILRLSPVTANEFDGPWTTVWKVTLSGHRQGMRVRVAIKMSLELNQLHDKIAEATGWIDSAKIQRVTVLEGPEPLLREITAETGIDVRGFYDTWKHDEFRSNTGGVYLSDYNNDGILDVLIDDVNTRARLHKGLRKGTFEDVTKAAGLPDAAEELPLWTVSCWGDFDNDGDEDLISEASIYENLGDGTFRDVTASSNLVLTPAAGYAIADFDGDGLIDLYVCHSGAYRPGQSVIRETPWIDGGLGIDNVLWKNRGNWQFDDVTVETNTGGNGSSCFAAVWLDSNDDNRPDLFAINEFGRNSLLIQHADGTFTETSVDPTFGGFSMGVTAGDFDNDGHTDLYVANMYSKAGNRILANVDSRQYDSKVHRQLVGATTGNRLYRSNGDGTFTPLPADKIVAAIGWAYGPNFVDLNGDGWLDIYATAGFKSSKRGKPDG